MQSNQTWETCFGSCHCLQTVYKPQIMVAANLLLSISWDDFAGFQYFSAHDSPHLSMSLPSKATNVVKGLCLNFYAM